jgi:pantoate--beta-alanine ligase
VERALEENDSVVVSIFVNPTQFSDPADLASYPRQLDNDLEVLLTMEVDMVFTPSVKEMYPEEEGRRFDFGRLGQVMEGSYRKGHFNGVAQIVSKLFDVIKPDRAYFGQKDFQQLVIVRRLVEMLDLDIAIVPCPVIREEDGLAMSSRNLLLSKKQRNEAPFIFITLSLAREKRGSLSPREIEKWVRSQFMANPDMALHYFEIVEDRELKPVRSWDEKVNKVGCIAVQLGNVRLIDNIIFD